MKKIEIEEMKKIELAILKDVADFCEKENIRYYLTGGTLLGAIRHNGFIPWDDDIDIQMPRPDYERFIHEYSNENFEVCCWELDHNFLCTYAKVSDKRTKLFENADFGKEIGVNIDVFPVDGLPKSAVGIKLTVALLKILWGLVVCANIIDISNRRTSKKIEITIMRFIYKLFPIKRKIPGLVNKVAKINGFENSNKVATLVWGYGEREVINKATASYYEKHAFEDAMLNVPVDYNDYLTHIYGDYMQLPPEEERIYKHGAEAYLI